MGFEITMSSKGQIVIPKDVRDALNLKSGERMSVHREGRRIILEAAAPPRARISYEEFRNRVPRYEGPPVATDDMTSRIGTLFDDWQE
ncbi:AbrB/MazE/SpoVT family DNA-binding domain-containing protein [Sphingomonas sp. A2-49]|uniref:AbrB/MazE/SpoVT family DNA-binding domain-containing protein n=1 Tax=Sphingomonas sp. A2-49 TaxID=1391375 RepID=UPI0021CF5324|nr:AbrB/MazE/SpoVT family DNA-binding domain-containing protein [Sphingomonas sp. A2-49]MCU6453588.1 AbrB/MazE/SpoVT family DNA-binding domain-containing protein [Sphingomonas sp. A2-49]